MKPIEAIRAAATAQGMPLAQIGRNLGASDNYVSAIASRGSSPRSDTLAAIAAACGYRLALVPENDLPKSALVIDPPETDQDAERKALERKRERLRRELEATEQLLS